MGIQSNIGIRLDFVAAKRIYDEVYVNIFGTEPNTKLREDFAHNMTFYNPEPEVGTKVLTKFPSKIINDAHGLRIVCYSRKPTKTEQALLEKANYMIQEILSQCRH